MEKSKLDFNTLLSETLNLPKQYAYIKKNSLNRDANRLGKCNELATLAEKVAQAPHHLDQTEILIGALYLTLLSIRTEYHQTFLYTYRAAALGNELDRILRLDLHETNDYYKKCIAVYRCYCDRALEFQRQQSSYQKSF